MRRRRFLAGLLALPLTARAGTGGVVILNVGLGFTAPVDKRHVQGILRGTTHQSPTAVRTLLYLPPARDPALEAVLSGLLKWNEFTFERQMPIQEAAAGRPLFKRLDNETAVLDAVVRDPGGVGVVSSTLVLHASVLVAWSSEAP